ncbi:protein-L-isoaspartate(D-aspartate) O-methyltransferase [Candidatus Woesearchaeota archaeon]|nr:protein-L-isoaspartate(D-aspartate) O-methyltransferase [Candidatus Woesearchaeota archaeon]
MMYVKQRKDMVEFQLKLRGISDERVLKAMEEVPRHEFVPEDMKKFSYDDAPLPIGEDQTISQPYMVAIMTELMELKGKEKVLEIGTGSGYQGAVLAKLAKQVYTVEKIELLAKNSEKIYKKLGIKNVEVIIGDGTLGLKKYAPYDAIIVTAGAHHVPKALVEQLKDNGRLVIPVGDRFVQTLLKIKKEKGKLIEKDVLQCRFVPLFGEDGWED